MGLEGQEFSIFINTGQGTEQSISIINNKIIKYK